ncbi:MarR family winged helix-turn-helix transcriptional regulator [Methanobrevibacter sp.]|uniref:MarR family winged helix-turn-helix transcriptional regulator n=1 Tax=Methanobrevibacter sp. TaxID=66852 RepID=UPI00388D36EA
MVDFEKEENSFIPIILYMDYINAEYNKFLKNYFKNINPRDFTYLVNIFYHPNSSQRELADLLMVSEANVGQIIKRLEKNKLIYREFDEKNKSSRIINLTDEGKSAVFTLLGIAYKWEAKFFENYSLEDKKRFISMISDYYQKSINDNI